jgi:hypothetical protein
MKLWRRVTRYLAVTAMIVIVGAGLVAMSMVPGVHLADVSGRVRPCGDLPGRAVPSQGAQHLSYLGKRHVQYSSSPPTSGPHMPWLISAGVYRAPIPPEYQVHLLEHGKVLVQYPTGAPRSARTEFERFARRRPDAVVVAPSSAVRVGVALTAWQRIDFLPKYDRHRIEDFVDGLAGRYNHGWSHHASDCVRVALHGQLDDQVPFIPSEPQHGRDVSAQRQLAGRWRGVAVQEARDAAPR